MFRVRGLRFLSPVVRGHDGRQGGIDNGALPTALPFRNGITYAYTIPRGGEGEKKSKLQRLVMTDYRIRRRQKVQRDGVLPSELRDVRACSHQANRTRESWPTMEPVFALAAHATNPDAREDEFSELERSKGVIHQRPGQTGVQTALSWLNVSPRRNASHHTTQHSMGIGFPVFLRQLPSISA